MHQPRRCPLLRTALTICALTTAAWTVAPALAAVPAVVAVHGALTTPGGGLTADGAYLLTFSLYDSKDAKSALWTELTKVAVKRGQFSHALGSVKALSDTIVATGGNLWLGVAVDNDPELPRSPLRAALFARRAAVAERLSCSGCVTTAQLKFDGDINLGGRALKAGKVTADDIVAKSISAAAFIGSAKSLTDVRIKGGSCKAGQAVVGVMPDGSVKCANAMANDKHALGGLLTRVMTEKLTATAVPQSIADSNAAGTSMTLNIGDVGSIESLAVRVQLVNTDLSTIRIELTPPNGQKVVVCEPCGGKDSKSYDKTISASTPLKSGSLQSYAGASPKGAWKLTVVDKAFCLAQVPANAKLCNANDKTDGAITAYSVAASVLSSQSLATKATLGVGTFAGPPFICTASRQGHLYFDTKMHLLRYCDGKNWRESLPTSLCGNNIVNHGESCDDGNNKSGDGCTAKCQLNVCGDGIIHVGKESCDDGNTKNGDGCSANCAAEFSGAMFTPCNGTFHTPPTQGGCDSTYKGTTLDGKVKVTGGIQYWTVPATATYRIEAWGARSGYENGRGVSFAGKGIGLLGDFTLTQGTQLKILVGQVGRNNNSSSSAGGGGTFVATAANKPLIVAGGGGGHEGTPRSAQQDANAGTAGKKAGGSCQNWNGGTDGKGATHHTGGNTGGGGGGFYTDGGQGSNGGKGGKAFVNGGAGGLALTNNVHGGFGGGGGAYGNGGGAAGGGGYSGGAMGDNCGGATGGGGGSFNGGANSKVLGHHHAAGKVIIKLATN